MKLSVGNKRCSQLYLIYIDIRIIRFLYANSNMCIKAINILTLLLSYSSQFTIKVPSYLLVQIAIRKVEIPVLQNILSFLIITVQTY